MQPTNYFSDFDDLFERMNRNFGAMSRSAAVGGDFAVDVARQDDTVVITADVPGFEREDIDVSIDEDLLTIRAESETDASEDDEAYVRRERHHHAMRRTIHLPAEVDAESASASYRNGVLTVTVPVAGESDVRHIDVE